MDDSLHEMTHVRHDLPGLLQLRPRPPKQFPGSNLVISSIGLAKEKGVRVVRTAAKEAKMGAKAAKMVVKAKAKFSG